MCQHHDKRIGCNMLNGNLLWRAASRTRYLLLIVALLASALSHGADSPRINTSGRVLELDSPLLLNNQPIGAVLLAIDTDDTLSVDAEGFIALLQTRLSEQLIDRLQALAEGDRLTGEAMTTAGLPLSFDMSKLALNLAAPQSALRERTLSLSPGNGGLRDLANPEKISGFVNLRSRATSNRSTDDTRQTTFTLDTRSRLRLASVVIDNDSTYVDRDDGNQRWRREATRLFMDLPDWNTRISAGDVFWLGRGFQSSLDILGIQYGRDFSLNPGRNIRPLGRSQFSLAETSIVSVIIDGTVVRRFELEPGRYDLQDIPLATGSNNIELLVENSDGDSEIVAFNQLFDFSLLAIGEVDFAMTAGVLAEFGGMQRDYNDEAPAVAAYYRRGLLDWLTAGLTAQATRQAAQVGLELSTATEFGPITTRLGVSRRKNAEQGLAVETRFDSVAFDTLAFDFSLGYTSRLFDTVTNTAATTNSVIDQPIPVATSSAATAWRATFGVTQHWQRSLTAALGLSASNFHGDRVANLGISVGLSGSLSQGRSLTWSARAIATRQEELETGIVLGLSYRPIPQGTLRTSYQTLEGDFSLGYRQRHDRNRLGGYSLEASLRGNRDGAARGGLQAGYTGNRYLIDMDHTEFRDADEPDSTLGESADANSESSSSSNVSFASAIVMAGGQWAISRPVRDSFAIVNTHSTLGKRSLALNPSTRGASASTDFLGPAVQPDLGRYAQYTLGFEVDDLPLGYDLGAGLFRMSPPLGSGYSLTVGSAATVTVIGVLVDGQQNGEPIALGTGKVFTDANPDADPIVFFTNRIGKFAVSGIAPGEYRLVLDGPQRREVQLRVPDDGNTLLRLEELRLP